MLFERNSGTKMPLVVHSKAPKHFVDSQYRTLCSKQILFALKISMGTQMVASEIKKYFHARFGKIFTISRAFRRGNY